MTPEQKRLARHALGLPNRHKRSYRNRFFVGDTAPSAAAWVDLVINDLATPAYLGASMKGYCLTIKGAKAALEPGETLDPEDFPETSSEMANTGKGDQ